MQINWAPYETEVRQLYVTEGKAAESTVKYLNDRYDLHITVGQFEAKFGGLKELRAAELQETSQENSSQNAQDKASDDCVNSQCQSSPCASKANRQCDEFATRSSVNASGASCRQDPIKVPEPQDVIQQTGKLSSIIPAVDEGDAVAFGNPAHPPSPNPSEMGMSDFVDVGSEEFDLARPQDISSRLSTPELITTNDFKANSTTDPAGSEITQKSQTIVLYSPRASAMLRDSPITSTSATKELGESSFPSWQLPEIPAASLKPKIVPGPDSDAIKALLGQVSIAAPEGQASWVASRLRCVQSEPPHPIVTELLDRILSPGREAPRSQYSSTLLPFVDQIFLPVAHLISNGLLIHVKITKVISWVFQTGLAPRLFKFLQRNASRMEHFITETLFTIVDMAMCICEQGLICTEDGKFGKYRFDIIKLIELADSRALSGVLGAMLLSYFAQYEDLEAARLLVSRGANTNLSFHEQNLGLTIHFELGRTPLIAAVRGGSLDMLRYLIECSAHIEARLLFPIEGDSSPLAEAVKKDRIEMVKIILENGAEIAYDMKVDRKYILPYAKSSCSEIYNLLIESLENKPNLNTMTMMILMGEKAERGSRSLSNFLLKHEIVRDDLLEGALWHAVETDNLRAVMTLLDHGVDPNALQYRRLRHAQKFGDHPETTGKDVFKQGEPFESSHPLVIAFSTEDTNSLQGIVYFLEKAGIQSSDEILSRICSRVHHRIYHMPILLSMAQAGHHKHLFGPCALECAAHNGNILECGLLLDAGIDVNSYANPANKTALQSAAKEGHLATVEFLIKRGANVNSLAKENPRIDHERPLDRERLNFTALQAAAFHGHVQVVDCLIAAGADVALPAAKENGIGLLEASAGAMALDKAFRAPKPSDLDELIHEEESFMKLLNLGAPINGFMGTSGALLHALIRASKIDCLELVLKAGATTEDRDYRENQNRLSMRRQARILHGMTPIQLAAYHQKKDVIELLMRHGADINAPAADVKWARTALQAAIGDNVVVDPYRVSRGPQPLKANTDILEFLLQRGADINAPPGKCFGRTALQATTDIIPIDSTIVMYLLQHGANINAPPAEEGGVTVLQGVAIRGDLELATNLIALGADVNAAGSAVKGRTAIEGAADYGRIDMVQLLLEKGALPHVVDGFSRAIGFAEKQGRFDIADLLREKEEALGFKRSTVTN